MPGPRSSKRKRSDTADARRRASGAEPNNSSNNKNNEAGEPNAPPRSSFAASSSQSPSTSPQIASDTGANADKSAGGGAANTTTQEQQAQSKQSVSSTSASTENAAKMEENPLKRKSSSQSIAQGDDGGVATEERKRTATPKVQEQPGKAAAAATTSTKTTTSVKTATTRTSAAAKAAANDQPPQNNEPSSELGQQERLKHLQAFLMQRQLLLKRMQQGRAAAASRVQLINQIDPTDLTSDQQVMAFRERLRQATSAARKQKSGSILDKQQQQQQQQQRAGSVSLRRGSSVGKRMNAALSSLAPGSSAAAAAAAAAGGMSPTPVATVGAVAAAAAQHPKGVGAATLLPSAGAARLVTAAGGAAVVGGVGIPASTAAVLPKAPSTAATKRGSIGTGTAGARSAAPKSNKAAAVAAAANPLLAPARGSTKSTAAVTKQQMATALQHAGIKAAPGLPVNNNNNKRLAALQQQHRLQQQQQQQQKPAVVCPPAVALREKRKAVRNQLIALLEKRLASQQQQQQQFRTEQQHPSKQRTGSGLLMTTAAAPSTQPVASAARSASLDLARSPVAATTRGTTTRLSSNAQRAAFLQGGTFLSLPRRRKTAWDYLLQEMKWMATDFREERKWNMAAARTVAHQIAANCQQTSETPLFSGSRVAAPERRGARDEDEDAMDVDSPERAVAARPTKGSGAATAARANGTSRNRFDRSYVQPSPDETESSVSVAKSVSLAVSEQVARIVGIGDDDDNSTSDLAEETADATDGSKATENAVADGTSNKATAETSPTTQSDNAAVTKPITKKQRRALMDQISQIVDDVEDKASKKTKSRTGSATQKTHGIALSTDQCKLVDSIEDSWGRVLAGAILKGTHAAGKTVLACSLLWRHRTHGPQIILCPTSSLVRWAFELRCFKGLKVSTFHGNSDPDAVGRNHVLVCDLQSLKQLLTKTGRAKKKFRSIIVDCRCSAGFEGSRLQTCLPQRKVVPPETLMSPDWWQSLVGLASDFVERRLVVESNGQDDLPHFVDGLPKKLALEILSWRAAFLLRTPVPDSSKMTAARALLSWARQSAMNAGDENVVLVEAVQKTMTTSVAPLRFNLTSSPELSSSLLTLKDAILWEARLCEMPPVQSEAYSRCCAEVQTCLQSSLYASREEWDEVADALLRLRRHCSHADLHGLMTGSISWFAGASYVGNLRDGAVLASSPSQPCKEIVHKILSGSTKFQALVSILIEECGFDELEAFRPKDAVASSDQDASSTEMPQRIAILAALPEVQIMVSTLLNCMGVNHELLPRTAPGLTGSSARVWVEHQEILSAFNGDDSLKKRSVPIVIGSVETVAGNIGGLSIEGADLVVCLDEDWSGRGEMLLYSILARSIKYREMTGGDPCRFTRLVAAKTCEASFLKPAEVSASTIRRTGAKSKASKEKLPMCLNPEGLFDVVTSLSADQKSLVRDCWRTRAPGTTYFVFPGSNLSALRDKKLAEVLGTTFIPPLLSSAHAPLFLPVETSEDQILDEIGFLSSLLEKERRTMRLGYSGGPVEISSPLVACGDEKKTFPNSVAMYLDRLTAGLGSRNLGLSRGSMLAPPLSAETLLSGNESDLGIKPGSDEEATVSRPDAKAASASLLFYPLSLSSEPKDASSSTSPQTALTYCRSNLYSSSYGSVTPTASSIDGNQGSEPLLYVPPLFPRILESSRLAKSDAELLKSRAAAESAVVNDGKKRAALDAPGSVPASKRPRPEDTAALASGESNDAGVTAAATPASDPSDSVENAGGTKVDSAAVLLDLSDDYGLGGTGAVPLPRDSALSAAYTSVENSAIPDGSDALRSVEWLSLSDVCDSEELGRTREGQVPMRSMVLFVSRKRPRGYSGRPVSSSQLVRAPQGNGLGSMPWLGTSASSFTATLPVGPNGLLAGTNGSATVKRPKKKPASQVETQLGQSSAFTRRPVIDPSLVPRPGGHPQGSLHPANAQDLYKKSLLAALRQSGVGTTMFEASSFRTASLQVKNRVGSRLIRHCWGSSSFDVGPGLPLHIAKAQSTSHRGRVDFDVDTSLWTSIVKRPSTEDSKIISDAVELSNLQRSAFRGSLVAPCRVDFGPFQSGFLSMPSGMTAVTQPRSRSGVSLPMGVKISPIPKDQTPPDFSATDDAILQQAMKNFGMNWNLAARSLRGFQEFRFVPQQRPEWASARSCRDRWQSIVRKDTSVAKNILEQEQAHRSVFTQASDFYEPGPDGGQRSQGSFFGVVDLESDSTKEPPPGFEKPPKEYLAPQQESTTSKNSSAESTSSVSRKSRTFAAFGKARASVRKNPISIPGVPAGSEPTVAPGHASHVQAVTAAVAPGKQKDMWPLQLLSANRNREAAAASAAAAAAAASASAASAASVVGTSASGRSHAGSSISSVRTAVPQYQMQPSAQEAAIARAHVGTSRGVPPPAGHVAPPPNPAVHSFAPPPKQSTAAPKSATQQAGQNQGRGPRK